MWPWLVKLVGGWLPIGTKPFGEYLGKILWAVGIILAVLIIWNKFTKPTTYIRPDQDAEQIVNTYHYESPKTTVGCTSLRVEEYYNKQKSKNAIILNQTP